jgi:putative glutamine amidotransferase
MKPIIGIISPRSFEEDRPFNNYIKFTLNFPKRIIEAGGIPIGIFFPNNEFNVSALELCDGFLFQGGPIIESSQIKTVHYAIEKKKPILGICLGMQTMAAYEWLISNFIDKSFENIDSFFKPADEMFFLKKVSNHNNLNPFYESQIAESKHGILLTKNSRLYNIFKTDFLDEPSIHNFAVNDKVFVNSKIFKTVGRSNDGVIEAIESFDPKLWMVGVQFHPEIEDKNKVLFKSFVDACKKK